MAARPGSTCARRVASVSSPRDFSPRDHHVLPQSPTSPVRARYHAPASPWPDAEGDEPEERTTKFAQRQRTAGRTFAGRVDRRRWIAGALVLSVFLWAVTVDRTTDARGRIRTSLHSASHRLHDLTAEQVRFNKSYVLNFPDQPQDTLRSQIKPDVRYITTMSYGGHANQFMAIENLLYLAKLLSRVAIIPTLTALHFDETPRDFSVFYDLDRFYYETEIPAVEMSALKRWDLTNPPPLEDLSCWSILEQTAGDRNINDGSMAVHNIDVKYWPLPRMESGSEGFNLWFESIHDFDYNREARDKWVARVKKELLPQQSPPPRPTGKNAKALSKSQTLKPGFDPLRAAPPEENLLCLDTTFFLGSRIFPPAYPLGKQYEAPRSYEGHGWIQAGQYMHFSPQLEDLADQYLLNLFGAKSLSDVPPFISVHIRRGDFQSARGLTSLEAYTDAVQRARNRLDWRMDHPDGWVGAGHARQKYFPGVRGRDYAVVATTDEEPGSDFVRQLKENLGWKVVDHAHMRTEEELGAWYPTMVDAAVLARGRAFVGTEWSTFSYLAGLRVK
ncbi:hypothetical protein JCM3770_002252 [Rhodotorula araucariae]